MSSADDNLLLCLLANQRNAAATFGEDSLQYQSIHSTVCEHLLSMQKAGRKTKSSEARKTQPSVSPSSPHQVIVVEDTARSSSSFGSLAFRPKAKG
ncbi:hypothetical protein LTR66_002280 [Elasticomyces elasticus]|nr:hypothetical protein LTR66_002280 [Elasticomyces elasticus]